MGLFSNKNKRDSAAQDGDRFYSKDDDAAIGERARAKRASHAGATANTGASARRSANDPLLPEKKRARRRLVGAIALALAAAVGLPMLLDSAPKPLAGDIAIQIPSKDKAAPLPVPAAPAASSDTAAASADAGDAPSQADKQTDKQAGKPATRTPAAVPARPKTVAAADSVDQGEEVIAPPKPAARKPDIKPLADVPKPERKDAHAAEKAERDRALKAEHDRVEKAEHDRAERMERAERADRERKAREAKEAERLARAREKEKEKAAAEDHPKAVPDKPVKHDDAARAMAILEGKGAGADAKHDTRHEVAKEGVKSDAPAPKATIQVAAMSSQDKAAELQARLSAAGISSYTEKAANGLIRVKIGPLAHDDADRVRAKLGKLGL
jgi:DedD protein